MEFDIHDRSTFYKVKEFVDSKRIKMAYNVIGHAHPTYFGRIDCNKDQKKEINKILKGGMT